MGTVIDIKGKRFGRLVAVERVEAPEGASQQQAYWRCKCDCGKEKVVASAVLRRGNTRSCGCLKRMIDDQRAVEPGTRCGRLVVVSEAKPPEGVKRKERWWTCRCVCGGYTTAKTYDLKKGNKRSCGCLRLEHAQKMAKEYNRRLAEAEARKDNAEHKSLWRQNWDYERGEDGKLKCGALTGVAPNMQTCETCGKEFDMYAGRDWAWKKIAGDKILKFCSYGCMRKHGRSKRK